MSRITNQTKNTLIADNARIADTLLSRMVGLLNRKNILPGDALVLTRCQSIHMFFMRFAIDVIFVSKDDRVVSLVKNIKPFQLSPVSLQAFYAIELPPGTIDRTLTAAGDRIWIEQ